MFAVSNLVGERVRTLRRRLGWTQHELAGKAGVAYITISRLERGETQNPTLGTMRSLADLLGVPLGDLAKGTPLVGEVLSAEASVSSGCLPLNGDVAASYTLVFPASPEVPHA
jgi:transcriptional regulator with XRE-family HTH domain